MQEPQPRSWLWGSISAIAQKAAEEFNDLKEVADNLETMGPLAACTAPPVPKRSSGPEDDGEIRVVEEERGSGCQASAHVPITPAATSQQTISMAQVEQSTPPKVDA